MDNLPNLQRSVSKFFDSRRKSQKRQKAAAAAAAAEAAAVAAATLEINRDQQLKTDQITTAAAPTTSTHQAYIENITTATTATTTTVATKSTGAIKKKPSIKSNNEKHHNKLRFFCRNNSSDKQSQQSQHLELPTTTSTSAAATTTERFVERFRRLHVNSSTHQSLDLDKPDEALEGVRSAPHLNVRPAHFALTQLRSLDSHLGISSQLHDSPEEPTPPEFAYRHLGSVATTNSNTSLESSFGELGETSTTNTKTTNGVAVSNTAASSVCYWAWQQTISTVASTSGRNANSNNNNNNNNADLYTMPATTTLATTAASTMHYNLYTEAYATTTTTPTTTTTIAADTKRGRRSPLLKMPVIKQLSAQPSTTDEPMEETMHSIKTTTTANNSKPPSRSGSASKLMNFLFKSSNESNKSLQGQSNEGFTASSHGSSSGEWEYLGAVGGVGHTRMEIESLPEETQMQYLETDEAGSYFQYTLSSPNNPFLPEIVARSYHSTCDSQEFELPPAASCIMHTHSQLSTPAYSRAGSQESTHSEGAPATATASDNMSPASSSSRAGRQRRKLFSLHSPRFLQQRQQETPLVIATSTFSQVTTTTTATTAGGIVPLLGVEEARQTSTEHGSFIRSLNPFSYSARRASSHGTSPKRGSQKFSSKVNTPATMPADLNARREEFLRATMKICLVVSPPNTKLQVNGVLLPLLYLPWPTTHTLTQTRVVLLPSSELGNQCQR